jgi:hypothetical protein
MEFFQGNYRWNEAGNVFLHAFSVGKSIDNNIFFITNRLTDGQKIINKRFTDGVVSPVISSVN